MIIAHFVFGPMDGEFLPLPTSEPWPFYVLPKIEGAISIPLYYCLAGQEDRTIWSYLFDEFFDLREMSLA